MSININCKKATLYAAQKEEKKLSLWRQLQLWNHLAICSICKLFVKQTAVIEKAATHMEHHTALLTKDEQEKMIEKIKQV